MMNIKKLVINIIDSSIVFNSEYGYGVEKDLNNTNIIDINNAKFSEEYIYSNFELIKSYINLIIVKFNVSKAIIKDLTIAELSLDLIKNVDKIIDLCFYFDASINYSISFKLLENNNLRRIECYNMPEVMISKFDDGVLDLRSNIFYVSEFISDNKLITLPKIVSKERVVFNSNIFDNDKLDIEYFFKENRNLKRVDIKKYSNKDLLYILKLIKEYDKENIKIYIYENKYTTDNILKDIDKIKKYEKKYNVKIVIIYSKEYKEKNGLKQINYLLLNTIILFVILFCLLLFFMIKSRNKKDDESLDKNIESINNVIEDIDNSYDYEETDVEEEPIEVPDVPDVPVKNNPYTTKYENIYQKLLELNSDTVGWLEVKNTNVNYPVVKSNDNDYYLYHAFDKSSNRGGWIFLDYRNNVDSNDKNYIIYGHSMSNGTMFGTLKNVINESWYSNSSNLIINFSIKGVNYKYQIFSIYVIDNTDDYLITNFSSNDSFISYINKSKERSIKDFNVDVTENDSIVTLSTCYTTSAQRLVIQAKRI